MVAELKLFCLVSCDSVVNVVDALYILQYDVGSRRAVNSCPLPSGTLLESLFVQPCDSRSAVQMNVAGSRMVIGHLLGATRARSAA